MFDIFEKKNEHLTYLINSIFGRIRIKEKHSHQNLKEFNDLNKN